MMNTVVIGAKYGLLAGVISFELSALLLVLMLRMTLSMLYDDNILIRPTDVMPTTIPLQSQQGSQKQLPSSTPSTQQTQQRPSLTQQQSSQKSQKQVQSIPTAQAVQKPLEWPATPIRDPLRTFMTIPQSAVIYAAIVGACLGGIGGGLFGLLRWFRLRLFGTLGSLIFSYCLSTIAFFTIELTTDFSVDYSIGCPGGIVFLLRLSPGVFVTYKLVYRNLCRLTEPTLDGQPPATGAGKESLLWFWCIP